MPAIWEHAESDSGGTHAPPPCSGDISGTLPIFVDNQQRMGLQRIYRQVHSGLQTTKGFLGNAYATGSRFLSNIDQYAGVARNVFGAVAPMVGSMTGPVGQAVGAAVGGGMRAFGHL
mgnify:CR=1 FL=1